MSFTSKAIFAAFVLSLTPVVASAQSYSQGQWGGAVQHTYPNGGGLVINLGGGHSGPISNPGWTIPGHIGGTPVQTYDCGATQYQYLVGRPHNAQTTPHHAAVVYPGTIRTTQYIATRLNVSVSHNGYVDRVYCG